jgi:hypothetical protein
MIPRQNKKTPIKSEVPHIFLTNISPYGLDGAAIITPYFSLSYFPLSSSLKKIYKAALDSFVSL